MKNYFLAISLIFFMSCGPKVSMTSEVSFKSYNNEIMNLDVIGYGSNNGEALENAQKNAIDIVLFRGIPNSNLNSPLAGTNENDIRMKNKDYFESFYGKKRYLSFITQSVSNTPIHRFDNGKKGVQANIKINIMSLRNDLTENNIIRKFGY